MTQQARRACRLPVPSGKRGFRPQTAAAICGAIIPRKQKESSPPSLNALLFTDRVKMSIEGQRPPSEKAFPPSPSTPSFFPRRFMSRLSVRAGKRRATEQGNATEETRRREIDTRGKSADARQGASAPRPRSEATSSSAPGRRRGNAQGLPASLRKAETHARRRALHNIQGERARHPDTRKTVRPDAEIRLTRRAPVYLLPRST